mmetsp:Transcript_68829/g.199696  ORF Transcript_68829/g.199696 Transcript_68829/m.199696 type:complete len:173 (+) Transcript_68829:93-611(+)|eukprot:CAMPEP_0176037892 /NCGR_PEP_ID=MMETSP0120_2-20121206/18775_1 /TAXON_ID=160619 /ORGANISM="Kryptoperidinium foliaceum, Strain CCMP 1326" /LENGTH=172 /DNA_ID=CAMNT_0017371283 /DNA_START=93 /DNA_END=611 /DNA_ORIENTATION=+
MARTILAERATLVALLAAASLRVVGAVHACDAEQGALCPAEAGAALGNCLKDPSKWEGKMDISKACKDFMAINDACADEIDRSCSGMAYSDDTMVCLTQWTAQDMLSAGCEAALPKKQVEEDQAAVDAEKKAWREKRKKARQDAQDMMEQEKKSEKKEKKRRRKSKKSSDDL